MFTTAKTQLFSSNTKKQTSATNSNSFVTQGLKKSAEVESGNGALKYDSTGNPFIDQFGKLGEYKVERSFTDISNDMSTLWAINPYLTVCFVLFMRTITRTVSLFNGTKTSTVQRGAGLKNEGIVRMVWLNIYHEDMFWKNINLFISVGSWRDIFEILRYDLKFNGWEGRSLKWDKFGTLILVGLENPNTSELIKKYLPQIKAKSQCTTVESQANTLIGKWISSLLFGNKFNNEATTYKNYRKLKSSGIAHQWQQLISKKLFDSINFNTVHGRALSLMVSGKFIENQGLTSKYEQWIESKPIAKYTGYVNELFAKLPTKKYQIDTLNAQFKGLVETVKKGASKSTSLIVVRDTSGSMSSPATGTKMSAGDVAKALALFFSEMLPEGFFSNSWIEFNSDAKMHQWKGSTPYEKWSNDNSNCIGTTNFQSVIKLLCFIKSKGIPESEFPTGILCISDSEFNPTELGVTNVEQALITLHNFGFSQEYLANFQIVLWNLRSNAYGNTAGNKFETYRNQKNVFYFSGFDGSIIAFLTGIEGKEDNKPTNAEELFKAAMEQEILQMIEI